MLLTITEYFTLNNLFFSIFVLFIISFAIQFLFFGLIFSRLAFYKDKKSLSTELRPVSVVICAKNEHYNLRNNLISILEQDYPDFEVVVVNDCSDDDSKYLLRDYSQKYPNLKVVTIIENVNFFSGKKFALSVGIKSAKNELLILTDADCRPEDDKWLRSVQPHFTDKTDIVLGYGPYIKKKGLLNLLIRFDTFHVAVQYLSYCLIGLPYMGVGRNLAYKKSIFYKNKGFTSHLQIPSGDDDLFINQVANKNNSKIVIDKESYTYSEPKETFDNWFFQKKRHLTTSKYYKFTHKLLLASYSISQFLYFITLITLFFIFYKINIIVLMFVILTALQMVIFYLCTKKLNDKIIIILLPLLQIFLLIINVSLSFSNIINRESKWK